MSLDNDRTMLQIPHAAIGGSNLLGHNTTSVCGDLFPFLTTNECPSGIVYDKLRQTYKDAQAKLTSVEARIAQLEKLKTLLRDLRREQSDLEQTIHDHKIILSPLRLLSTEILREILLFASDPHINLDTQVGAWPLSQVCCRWRAIVVTEPEFWSTIRIPQIPKARRLSIVILREILHRSTRPQPVMLDITLNCTKEHEDIVVWGPIIELLSSASSRWRSLDFSGSARYAEFFKQANGNIPELQTLTMSFGERVDGVPEEVVHFEVAPKLRTVNHDTWFLERVPTVQLRLPWSQLTRCSLKPFFLHDLPAARIQFGYPLSVLSQVSNVRRLDLWGNDALCPPVQNPIQLVHLRDLRIAFGARILDHLTIPILRCISIEFGIPIPRLLMPLSHLLQRSGCLLTGLSLRYDELDEVPNIDAAVVSLYRLLPSLKRLAFDVSNKMDSPMHALMSRLHYRADEADHALLPELRSLTVTRNASVPFDSAKFLEIVASRRYKGASREVKRLQRLQFHYDHKSPRLVLNLNTIHKLPVIVENGLRRRDADQ